MVPVLRHFICFFFKKHLKTGTFMLNQNKAPHGKAEAIKGKAEAETMTDFFGPVICSYTRDQALADGVLVDVSELAREAGFKIPVAVTASVWADCIDWPENSEQGFGQSIDGRLWDVLFMAYYKIKSTRDQSEDLLYQLWIIPTDIKANADKYSLAKETTLKINIGGGDNGEPVLTIMKPNED
jgi:hypothetical protein